MEMRALRGADADEYTTEFGRVLRSTYFAGWSEAYLASDAGRQDWENQLSGRLDEVHRFVVPWVEEVFPLSGARVLEIGCGTGSSTVPFATKAASVQAFDLAGSSLEAARGRCRLLQVENVRFHELSSRWAQSDSELSAFEASVGTVDVVLLFALLEHLTVPERLNVLRTAWKVLRPGGILVTYETPNRLSCFDWHSFQLPFFHTLPDELALKYSERAPRADFSVPSGPSQVEALYRLGRGISFHEFDLAIGVDNLQVLADGFSPHLRVHQHLEHAGPDRAVYDVLRQYAPNVPRGFARPSLDLVVRKPDEARAAKVKDAGLPEALRDDRDLGLGQIALRRGKVALKSALPKGLVRTLKAIRGRFRHGGLITRAASSSQRAGFPGRPSVAWAST